MADINKSFEPEQAKKIALQLTKSPTVIRGYTSTLPKPRTPKTQITQQEKTR
ncbi:MAG: hypothetical protein HRU36_03710 [Rickettsiales bacterium]|nr:hypothetical protein [Rickettsiales bacterium]